MFDGVYIYILIEVNKFTPYLLYTYYYGISLNMYRT